MLMIPLDQGNSLPLYEQIYEFIKEEIKAGNLSVHTKLPSTRGLSNYLQISRNTVDLAYNQLVSEGYIEAVPKNGYYVNQIGELIQISHQKKNPYQRNEAKVSNEKIAYDFTPFALDISSFPFQTWKKISNQCMNDMDQTMFLLGDNQGDVPLRQAIVDYLHTSRGVHCTKEQVIVGAGADYLLQLLSKLLSKDVKIAMENPTYIKAYQIFTGMDFNVFPISLDKEGMNIYELRKSKAEIAYVTPSHQYPLGTVMTVKRKRELLTWAEECENHFIIEDDHDSEFRYKGRPIKALQGMDTRGKIIYIGTFSRAIAPAIRVGYMVLPENLLKKYQKNYYYYSSTVSRIDQAILCEFIQGGYFERHVNKMRKRYKNRHDAMIHALRVFGDKIKITGENAGLHLAVEFFLNISEDTLIKRAKDANILLYGIQKYDIYHLLKNHEWIYDKSLKSYEGQKVNSQEMQSATILLGYANLTEKQIEEGIFQLFGVLCKE